MRRIWKKICPICGAEFEAGTNAAKYCPHCRELGSGRRHRLLTGGKALCANCGKEFEGHGSARFCSDICRRSYNRKKATALKRKYEGLSVRACHDCGRATTDYRCPACREKFRQRNNFSPDASCPEAWLYA